MKISLFALLLVIIVAVVSQAVNAEQRIYVVEITNSGGAVTADAYVKEGFASNSGGDYRYTLLSAGNKVLDTFTFPYETQFQYEKHSYEETSPEEGIVEMETVSGTIGSNTITAAYFPEGSLIKLSKPDGTTMAEVDVSRFSQICGNDKCEVDEASSCPFDCLFEETNENSKTSMKTGIIIAATIIGLIAIVIILLARKNSKKEDSKPIPGEELYKGN